MVGGVYYHSCCYYHCYYYRSTAGRRVNLSCPLNARSFAYFVMIYCCLIMHLMWTLMGRTQP